MGLGLRLCSRPGYLDHFTAKDAKDTKEEESLTAKDAKGTIIRTNP